MQEGKFSDVTAYLQENVYMKILDFSWNGCGDQGAIEFSKTLKVNNILTSLDLTACRISHDGFIKLITALSLNESLLHLKVKLNPFTLEFMKSARSSLNLDISIDENRDDGHKAETYK